MVFTLDPILAHVLGAKRQSGATFVNAPGFYFCGFILLYERLGVKEFFHDQFPKSWDLKEAVVYMSHKNLSQNSTWFHF